MRVSVIVFALVACGCSGPSPQPDSGNATQSVSPDAKSESDVRAEFLRLAGNDPWADWPIDLIEDANDHGRACIRVAEPMRQTAIDMLAEQPAVPVNDAQYRLIGTARPPGGGSPYLLRAFSSTNSIARVKWAGDAVVVHSDAVGGLSDVRRHPCISILRRPPARVFTVAAYDL